MENLKDLKVEFRNEEEKMLASLRKLRREHRRVAENKTTTDSQLQAELLNAAESDIDDSMAKLFPDILGEEQQIKFLDKISFHYLDAHRDEMIKQAHSQRVVERIKHPPMRLRFKSTLPE